MKVRYAVMHGTIHTPETGAIGPVLSNVFDPQRYPVNMTLSDDSKRITVEAFHPKNRKQSTKLEIPITNFTHFVLDEKNS